MLEIDFVFFGDGGEINLHSIPRGAQNTVRVVLFGDQLMESRVRLNGHKILLVSCFYFTTKKREIWYTGRKKWKEFNKMIWLFLGSLWSLVDCSRSLQRFVKSRMQTREHGVKLMCNWNVGMTWFQNLIETVKGYASTKEIHQQSDSTSPTSSASFFTCRSNGSQWCSFTPSSGHLCGGWKLPRLESQHQLRSLHEELTNTENKIFMLVNCKNSVTSNHNVTLKTFPTKRNCWNIRLQTADFFKCLKKKKVPKRWTLGLGD